MPEVMERLERAIDYYAKRGVTLMQNDEAQRLRDLLKAARDEIQKLSRELDEAHDIAGDIDITHDELVGSLRKVLEVAGEITGNMTGPADGTDLSYRWVEARESAKESLYWAEQDILPDMEA